MNYKEYKTKRLGEIEQEQQLKGLEFRPNKYKQRPAREWVRLYLREHGVGCLPEELREAIETLFLKTKREERESSPANQFLFAFGEGCNITGLYAFKTWGLGQKECRVAIDRGLVKAKPDHRKWIKWAQIDGEDSYTCLSIGPNPPEGWDGLIPDDKIII